MKIKIEIAEKELRELIVAEFERKTDQIIENEKVRILVKSKQNYKSEWEVAAFKATYDGEL